MLPEEAPDRITDPDAADPKANSAATATEADADTGHEGHRGRDEGGDPPCWLGLIDDQRDHQ